MPHWKAYRLHIYVNKALVALAIYTAFFVELYLVRYLCAWDSIGVACRYRLDGSGFDHRWGRDFPDPSRPTLRPNQSPARGVPKLLPDVKIAGTWRWPHTILCRGRVNTLQILRYSQENVIYFIMCSVGKKLWKRWNSALGYLPHMGSWTAQLEH